MGERTLGFCLRLLSIAIWISPIIAAFAAHGWDPKETLMPDREIEIIKESIIDLLRKFSENGLVLVDRTPEVPMKFTGLFEDFPYGRGRAPNPKSLSSGSLSMGVLMARRGRVWDSETATGNTE